MKNHLLSIAKRHPTHENLTAFKIARATARQVINSAKRNSWEQFVSSINSHTPSTKLWKQIRKIANNSSFDCISALENEHGDLEHEEHHLANIMAEHFYSVSKHTTPTNTNLILPKEASGQNYEHSASYNRSITLSEVRTAVNSMRNSAPGPDNIHPVMIKHLNENSLRCIQYLFNQIWLKRQLPREWKEAHILPFLKADKNKLLPTSYRPISLTNILCKVLEKIVATRLSNELESKDLLDRSQSGF
jgi:hypothetical protein